jgi:NAD(P)-dependent dehydrogenase (short-subunit alcohol dehydrogenase family)
MTSIEIGLAASALRDKGFLADTLTMDVSDVASFAKVIDSLEPYAVSVNNAGTNRPNPFTSVAIADFDHFMNRNVRAALFAAQAVTRRSDIGRNGGSIIKISADRATAEIRCLAERLTMNPKVLERQLVSPG